MQQISMFDILDDQPTVVKKYRKINSNVGSIIYYLFGDNNEYVKFRNVTLEDFFWSFASVTEFDKRFRNNCKSIETFASKRINGFNNDKVIISVGDAYHLLTKKKFDGYLYEVNATMHKVFTKKDYPDIKFAYTKYHIQSLRGVSLINLEWMKAAETMRFNQDGNYSVYTIREIAAKVHQFIKELKL